VLALIRVHDVALAAELHERSSISPVLTTPSPQPPRRGRPHSPRRPLLLRT
jgi:hypothetical protein